MYPVRLGDPFPVVFLGKDRLLECKDVPALLDALAQMLTMPEFAMVIREWVQRLDAEPIYEP